MARYFNVNGVCRPECHYMVNLEPRLEKIKRMVDDGDYFTINRGRQYGKTTTLNALAVFLEKDYKVISLDFQTMSTLSFEDEQMFVAALAEELLYGVDFLSDNIREQFQAFADHTARVNSLNAFFRVIRAWCEKLDEGLVLIIDEVDTAMNNQVFIDFLAQLRAYYLKRPKTATFQSVILAGVYDVRNIRRKLRPEDEHKMNSPWNIAADFNIPMSFSTEEIGGMLAEYEADHHTGMNIGEIAGLLYEYTSGYPVLVSRLCKLIDEYIVDKESFSGYKEAWTRDGVLEAVRILLQEKNALFDSLFEKLNSYPEMKERIRAILMKGDSVPYNVDDPVTDLLHMFGFVKSDNGKMQISNRIFETRLYNYFLMPPETEREELYNCAEQEKNQFIRNGQLDMKRILEKFVLYFDDIYGDRNQKFLEEDGRRYFMLFLRPIINGTGNYYVEAQTRNSERTDLIIDYRGKQYIVELKIYRGNAYHERGETQLIDYLDYYHLTKGYMLSFNFNKKKHTGVKEIVLGDKVLVEAVV